MLIPYTFWPRRRTWLVLRYGLLTVLVSAFILGTLMMNSDDDARSAHHHHAPIEYEAIDLEAEEEYQQVDDGERNMYPHKIEANKKRLKRKRKISSPGDLLAKLSRRRAEIKYDREIAADEAKFDPILGSDGLGAYLPEEEQKAAQEVMKKEAFNRMVSDRVPYNRTLPDIRDVLCKNITYGKYLPTASVIIIFTNEAQSSLLRTVWSVLNRSPARFLKEILLVDDFSDHVELHGKLDRYVQTKLPDKVRVIRLKERSGLIRARLAGAREAKGDVLIFLDSHCEVTPGWLEPLLHRIRDDEKAVLVPIIDIIDDRTLAYYHYARDNILGDFTWSGHFTWTSVPDREIQRRGSPIAPTRTATMAGGLFAIERQYFWDIGSYDEGMDVWGGENLEMSFRIWMCGGTLETIPCSRVGHIFRSFSPFTFPGKKDTHGINTARMAEVWMDEYKTLFFLYRKDLLTADIGDITPRKQLREKLNCKSFKWYLDNVIPEKFVMTHHSFAYGRVRNEGYGTPMCLDSLGQKESFNLGLFPCHSELTMSQCLALGRDGTLHQDESCAMVYGGKTGISKVQMSPCRYGFDDFKNWYLTEEGELIHHHTGKCLDRGNTTTKSEVTVSPCSKSPSQIWKFEFYPDRGEHIPVLKHYKSNL